MPKETYNTNQKQIYFKAYEHLNLLENDINLIKETVSNDLQISILGQISQFYIDKKIEISEDTDRVKLYWEKTLENEINFGEFYNPEIGNIYVLGNLAPTFLQNINNKTLGMLSAGPYGILRGIGASELQANAYLKQLKNGSYLLILRGLKDNLENLKEILEDKTNKF